MALVSKSTQYYSGFDPRVIPGCRIWLDAGDTNTITPSTGTVTQWNDKSGNGFNLVAASGGPTTASGTLNGLNVISNSGSQQMSNLSATVPSHEHAFFAVTRPTTITGYPQGNTRVISFQNTGYIVFPFMAPGPVPRGYISSFGGSATVYNGSTLVENSVAGSYSIICANIASGSQQIFRNGTLQSSCNATITAGTSDASFFVGGNGGGDNFQGNIAEIIIYSRQVSTDERQQIEGYLAWKWGLRASLPTSSPYSLAVPVTRFPQPPNLGSMLFWWDSSAFSTIGVSSGTVGAGGTVSSWNDQINNVALTVPSGLVGPVSTSNGVSFTNTSATITNGVSQVLQYFNVSSPWTMTQSMTILVACAPNRFDASRSPFFLQAPAALNVNPSYWLAVCMSSSEGNVVGAYNGSTAWLSLQQSVGTLTTAGAGRVDSLLSASSNFTWTNGTENAYGVNNIGRGTTVSGTRTITGMVIGGTATFGGNRAFDGLVYEILVYNASLSASAIRQLEGYLAWKWKFPSSLVSTHPFRSLPPATPSFSPLTLSGLAVWLDAADSSRFTFTTGSNVSQWNDKSGNGRNATIQSGSTGNPTLTASSLNGQQSLAFSGTQALVGTLPLNTTTATFIAVANFTGGGLFARVLTIGNGTIYDGTDLNAALPIIRENSAIASYRNNVRYSITSITPGTPFLAVSSYTGTSNIMYVNGNSGNGSAFTFTLNTGSYTVACDNSNASFMGYMTGNIGEVMIFSNALTTFQRQSIEGYLAWKWGLQNSLPTTHPFYKINP